MTRTEDRYRMKILHTDLDGTLLNKASLVSERTKEELKRFTDAGNLLVPNSGRPLLSIQKLLESAGIADMVRFIVAYNGALIWDRDKDAPAWTATTLTLTPGSSLVTQSLSLENVIVNTAGPAILDSVKTTEPDALAAAIWPPPAVNEAEYETSFSCSTL